MRHPTPLPAEEFLRPQGIPAPTTPWWDPGADSIWAAAWRTFVRDGADLSRLLFWSAALRDVCVAPVPEGAPAPADALAQTVRASLDACAAFPSAWSSDHPGRPDNPAAFWYAATDLSDNAPLPPFVTTLTAPLGSTAAARAGATYAAAGRLLRRCPPQAAAVRALVCWWGALAAGLVLDAAASDALDGTTQLAPPAARAAAARIVRALCDHPLAQECIAPPLADDDPSAPRHGVLEAWRVVFGTEGSEIVTRCWWMSAVGRPVTHPPGPSDPAAAEPDNPLNDHDASDWRAPRQTVRRLEGFFTDDGDSVLWLWTGLSIALTDALLDPDDVDDRPWDASDALRRTAGALRRATASLVRAAAEQGTGWDDVRAHMWTPWADHLDRLDAHGVRADLERSIESHTDPMAAAPRRI